MRQHDEVYIRYENHKGEGSERAIHPLGLSFWGEVWVLVAWCELRQDYRCFRLDRCLAVTLTGKSFADRPDRSLEAFIRQQKAASASADDEQ